MKNLMLFLTGVFIFLTITGAIHVLTSNGTADAGSAVVPMAFAVAFFVEYRRQKSKLDK